MTRTQMRYGIGIVIILGALVYLGFTVFTSSLQYYVTVGEFSAEPAKYANKILKVAGKLKEGSIVKSSSPAGAPSYAFVIVESGQELPVTYTGLVPDTFKAGADVVATGRYEGGRFVATHILAKCASKYEAKVKA